MLTVVGEGLLLTGVGGRVTIQKSRKGQNMGNGMNRAILIGNIGGEPDLHEVGESAVLDFSLATTERFKTREGTYDSRTEWHTIKVWGNRARALADILVTGMRVCVEGSIKTEKWEKDGQKRSKTTIVARDVILLGDPRRSDDGEGDQGGL